MFRQTLWLQFRVFAARGAATLLGLGVTVLLVRLYGAEVAGAFYFFVALVMFASTWLRAGFDAIILKYASASGQFEISDVYAAALLRRNRRGWLIALPTILGGFVATMATGSVALFFAMIFFFIAAFHLAELNYQSNYLAGIGRHLQAAVTLSIAPQFIFLVFLMVAAPILSASEGGVISAISLFYLASIYVATKPMLKYLPKAHLQRSPSGDDTPGYKREAQLLDLPSLLFLVQGWLPTVVCGILLTSPEVAVFSAASRYSMALQLIVNSGLAIYSTRMAAHYERSRDINALNSIVRQSILTTAVLAIIPAMMIFVFSEQLMVLVDETFREYQILIRILVIGQLANVLFGWTQHYLIMLNRVKLNFTLSVASAGVLGVSLPIVAWGFGLMGCALAVVAYQWINGVVYFVATRSISE